MKKYVGILLALSILFITSCTDEGKGSSSGESSAAALESTSSSSTETDSQASENINASSNKEQKSSQEISKDEICKYPLADIPWWKAGLSPVKLRGFAKPEQAEGRYEPGKFILYDDVKKLSYHTESFFSAVEHDPEDTSLLLDNAQEADDIGKRILNDFFVEIVALDDTKYYIEFYEDGIFIKEALPKVDFKNSTYLHVKPDAYKKIISNIESFLEQAKKENASYKYMPHIQWLSMMRESRITDVNFFAPNVEEEKHITNYSLVYDAVNPVVKGFKVTELRSLPNAYSMKISFNNGLIFRCYESDSQLLIYANDIDTALLYELKTPNNSGLSTFQAFFEDKIGIAT